MESTTIFLAKFWGWYMVLFCVLLIANPKRVQQLFAYLEDEKFLVTTSLLAIIVGLINILIHNIWEFDWTMIITIIGWISLIKGVIRFTFPKTALKAISSFNTKRMPIFLALIFFLGIYLLNQAYQWVLY